MKKNNNKAVHLSGETYYFPSVTNSGYMGGCLIDTGPDEAVYSSTDIRVILITHGHADHFSSASALRKNGAMVVASRDEVSLIENPEINIRGMFSWAKPSDEMVTRLFRGEGSRVDGYVDSWHDSGISVIPLPGHTMGHCGFLTADRVFFTGDALYIKELWERHPIPYAIDVSLVKSSLELINTLDFDILVPGHGHPVTKAESVSDIEHHISRIETIESYLLEFLDKPRTTEQAIAYISKKLSLVENPAQYWLAVTTIKGFLSGLLARKMISFFVMDHAGCWKKNS